MTNTMSNVQADLADGTIAQILGLTTIEGISGWTLARDSSGVRWAYPPMHYSVLTGEICRIW